MQKLQTKGFFSEPGVAAIDGDEAICKNKNEHKGLSIKDVGIFRPFLIPPPCRNFKPDLPIPLF